MKKHFLHFIYILTAIVMVVNIFFSIRDNTNFSMDNLPQGEKLYSVLSPVGDKILDIYCIDNSFGTAVRASVSGPDGVKNVYWQIGIDGVDSSWVDNSVININGVELNVDAGVVYNCRNGYSIFREGAIEGDDVVGVNYINR